MPKIMCEEESQLLFYRYTHVYNLTEHTGTHISFLLQRHRIFCCFSAPGKMQIDCLLNVNAPIWKPPRCWSQSIPPLEPAVLPVLHSNGRKLFQPQDLPSKSLQAWETPRNKWSKTYERGIRGECGCSEEVCWNAGSYCNRTVGFFLS